MSVPSVRGEAGPIQLGRLLGKGGEGAVYEVQGRPKAAAKIYSMLPSAERTAKLLAMPALTSADVLQLTAWPTEILRRADGKVCGFLMVNLEGSKDIHRIYSPKSRLADFPSADWRTLVRVALNTARAFAVLHERGVLVGDVNHSGVRVYQDATVKLIDCDSFQVSHQGRTFLCEVGVQDFTPPELQGKAFKDVARTANHDNFGLAVLIFQLLLNGRHPFAGIYAGSEDMPIEKAIPQFRYAYSSNVAATRMRPPPATAAPAVASTAVAVLWEKAFVISGTLQNGRPTARDWVAALVELEKKFTRCATFPSHYYFGALGACPWCVIEKSGVALFGIKSATLAALARGSDFNMANAWRDVASMTLPAQLPPPALLSVSPSPYAITIGRRHGVWKNIGVVAGLIIIGLGMALEKGFVVAWVLLGWLMGAWISGRGKVDRSSIERAFVQEQKRYEDLTKRRLQDNGDNVFEAKKQKIEILRDEWDQLPTLRQQRYSRLVAGKRAHALKAFLDTFEIEDATINGIGRGKKQTLASFGIETAADVSYQAIMGLQGFGPALTGKLLKWRQEKERLFQFDPNSQIDQRQVADLDRSIAVRRKEIEDEFLAERLALAGLKASILARRCALDMALRDAVAAYSQATADFRAS